MVFLLCFSNVRIAYREGGWDGWRAGGGEGYEVVNPTTGAAIMPIGGHTMAHATLVGHRGVQFAVGAILGTSTT